MKENGIIGIILGLAAANYSYYSHFFQKEQCYFFQLRKGLKFRKYFIERRDAEFQRIALPMPWHYSSCLNRDAVYINRDAVFINHDVVYKNHDTV